jgi:hypothetical protein
VRKWRPDQLDIWCAEWARERRKILGLAVDRQGKLVLQPWERLGQLRCTLGEVKEDRVGAGESSGFSQRFPEVYVGLSLEIHRGFTTMSGEWRQVMDAQYVWYEISPKEKAAIIGLTVPDYFNVLRMLKAYLSGYLKLDNSTLLVRA